MTLYGEGDIVGLAHAVKPIDGRVIRVDHMGVFVEWIDGASYAWPWQLELLGAGPVTRLRRIVKALHPDEVPDPITARLLQDTLGERVFQEFCEVVATPIPRENLDV